MSGSRGTNNTDAGSDAKREGSAPREQDAIYQNGRVAARVTGPEVDTVAREIRFAELYNSDNLLLPEDCEFRRYRILVQRIDDAMKIDRTAPHKGRILRGVTAEILGHREQ